jgi:hypothetical protein
MEDWELKPGEKPLFMDPDYVAGNNPDVSPTFDHELEPLPELEGDLPPAGKGSSRGYQERHSRIALYHVAGYTNNQIGRHLGYSPAGVSLALKSPFVQTEIERYRLKYGSDEALAIMHRNTVNAALRIEREISDPNCKEGHDSAKFVLEKVTGKPRQEVQVESGTILSFMEMLKDIKDQNARAVIPRDVTDTQKVIQASDAGHKDEFDAWLDTNL